jgi:hypothetical protein
MWDPKIIPDDLSIGGMGFPTGKLLIDLRRRTRKNKRYANQWYPFQHDAGILYNER